MAEGREAFAEEGERRGEGGGEGEGGEGGEEQAEGWGEEEEGCQRLEGAEEAFEAVLWGESVCVCFLAFVLAVLREWGGEGMEHRGWE